MCSDMWRAQLGCQAWCPKDAISITLLHGQSCVAILCSWLSQAIHTHKHTHKSQSFLTLHNRAGDTSLYQAEQTQCKSWMYSFSHFGAWPLRLPHFVCMSPQDPHIVSCNDVSKSRSSLWRRNAVNMCAIRSINVDKNLKMHTQICLCVF